jgi:CDGSH-type Zn-finger protein
LQEKRVTEPVIARKGPYAVTLEAGTYWWCACGRSKNQPYCDGSHKGTGLEPVKFELRERQQVWLCGCKRSDNKPFCDGAHKLLPG